MELNDNAMTEDLSFPVEGSLTKSNEARPPAVDRKSGEGDGQP